MCMSHTEGSIKNKTILSRNALKDQYSKVIRNFLSMVKRNSEMQTQCIFEDYENIYYRKLQLPICKHN